MLRIFRSAIIRTLAVFATVCASLAACRQPHLPEGGSPGSVQSADTATLRSLVRNARALSEKYPDSSIRLFDSTLRMSRAAKDTWAIAASLAGKAAGVIDTGGYLPAREMYREALRYFLAIDSFYLAGRAASGVGGSFLQTGDSDSAVQACLYAIELFTRSGNVKGRALAYNNISIAFNRMSRVDKAIEYNRKAQEGFRMEKDTANLVRSLINLGSYVDYPASTPVYLEAIDLSDRSAFPVGRFYGRLAMADRYMTASRNDSALYWLKQAEAVSQQVTIQKPYLTTMYSIFGRLYYMERQYALARRYHLKATRAAAEMGNLTMLVNEYRLFTKINILLGLKEESIDAYDRYNTYRDSAQDIRMTQAASELETRYRTAEKDAELARRERDMARQQLDIRTRNAGLLALSGVVLLLLLGGGAYLLHMRQKQTLSAQKVLTLEREAELAKVQAAMEAEEKERARIARNLHDGAGSILSGVKLYLSSLENQYRDLASSAAYRDTLGLLNEAVTEIRETSHNLMPRMLHLEGIHAAIRDYCDKIGRSGRLEVEFQSYGEPARFDIDFELMVFRTVQELLGNVMKHAGAKHVIVQLTFSPGTFTLTVEDDGRGMGKNRSGGGIGMFAVNSRVEAFRGTMDVDSSPAGTSVTLTFPVEL